MTEEELQSVFLKEYDYLYHFSLSITRNEELSRDIVHDVFISMHAKRDTVKIDYSLIHYLKRSVANHSLNVLKKHKRLEPLQPTEINKSAQENNDPDMDRFLEMLELAIRSLPAMRRAVFTLSRIEGLDNEEISSYLNITRKTVENHLTMALRDIRSYFSELKGDGGSFYLFMLSLL